ncbi:MAG TPA: hypothetical protein VGI42_03535 [Chthoniobacterales bacterium]
MKREDDQELWDLLGHVDEPKISPFFARNVLREVRERKRPTRFAAWLSLRRLIPATGLAVALVAIVLLRTQVPSVPLSHAHRSRPAAIDAQDYDLIADLDDLAASDDNSSLEDNVLL